MTVYLIAVFIAGAYMGSFLNLCIYRLPRGISIFKAVPFCPECGSKLKLSDRLPVLSFFISGGRYFTCHCRISFQYPIVECLTGLLFTAAFSYFGFGPYSAVLCLFFSLLMLVWFIDLSHFIIPDRIIAALLLLSPVYIYFQPSPCSGMEYFLGIIVISLPMLFLAYFFGGFGGGDIKLMAVCGLMLGMKLTLTAAVLAIMAGAAYSVFLLLTKRAKGKTAIPFGPFLAASIMASVLWGEQLSGWYLGLLNIY